MQPQGMDQSTDRTEVQVGRTLEHEIDLVREAIAMVASGGSRRVVVGGLHFGEALLEPAGALAAASGVRLVPQWMPTTPAQTSRSSGSTMTEHRRRVLIVEDDESLRRIVSRHLRTQGYEVEEASSVEGAVRTLEDGLRPSVVILDLNLPGDTGWDLLRGPSLAAAGSPPVVITSATTVSPKRLAEFGCAGYLPKPFPLETLVATLDRLVSSNEGNESP
jgi:CheY-like chemotaxis protein